MIKFYMLGVSIIFTLSAHSASEKKEYYYCNNGEFYLIERNSIFWVVRSDDFFGPRKYYLSPNNKYSIVTKYVSDAIRFYLIGGETLYKNCALSSEWCSSVSDDCLELPPYSGIK